MPHISTTTALARRAVSVLLTAVIALALLAALPSPYATAAGQPRWQDRLDKIVGGKKVAVSLQVDGSGLYHRRAKKDRIPASNQKLLLTMALLDRVDADTTLATSARATTVTGTIVHGDLWLVGSGDPSVTGGGSFRRSLPYRPSGLKRLARHIRDAGITRITGSVRGDLAAFRRDWWAHGWRSYYPERYAPLASGLAFNGNTVRGRHIDNPEHRAARSLTRKLEAFGVAVDGDPGTGAAPADADVVAEIRSVTLRRIVRHMNRTSSNFYAETLGKLVDARRGDDPVTIAGGAAAVQRWAARRGVEITAYDASGLSWANRASTRDIAALLDHSAVTTTVRSTLARPGTGTLRERLDGVRVRAKTGSLPGHSALSGYVYLERRGAWAAFSILCEGMSKADAVKVEDRLVEVMSRRAR